MPELPEVETIRKELLSYLKDKKVIKIVVKDKSLIVGDVNKLINSKVKDVKRLGKGLVIEFDNGYSLAAHIKLTGQFIYRGKENKDKEIDKKLVGPLPSKFTRLIFYFDDNSVLYFNDIRKFAWMKIVRTDNLDSIPFFSQLGPEPFKNLTFDYFKKIIRNSNSAIKSLLMNQKKIAGIGNIYANDALFLAKILPQRKAKTLSDSEIEALYKAIHKVLKRGLEDGGATEMNYVTPDGQPGNYQKHFLVYGKEGKPCPVCGTPIQKIKVGGRGTYFCPKCQK